MYKNTIGGNEAMEKKIGLYVLGGIVAGMAAIPVISNLNYYLRKKISERIRKEIDDYELDKMFEEDENEEEEEEYEDFFDEDLDEDYSMDFGSTYGIGTYEFSRKKYNPKKLAFIIHIPQRFPYKPNIWAILISLGKLPTIGMTIATITIT